MGRGANIFCGVMEDEVLEMDELAVDPEGSAGVGKMHPLDKAFADRAMRSSRRASAMPASEIGFSRLWIGRAAIS